MRKLLGGLFVLLLSVSLVFIFVGCGATTEDTTTTTTTTPSTTTSTLSGAVMKGLMENAAGAGITSVQGVKGFAWPPGTVPVNDNYPYVITTPESYTVGIWRARLFKGLSDTTPYLLASWEVVGNTPGNYLMTSSPTQMATNANYPTAGAYDHMIPTLAYLEQELPSSIVDFSGITRFRIMMATYGSYQMGDVLVYSGGAWNWINSANGSLSTTRPASPVNENWGSDATAEVNGHLCFEPQDVTFTAVTIPANPSGQYVFTLIFDVAATFAFNDLNENGVFEPGVEWPSGDVAPASWVATSGEASWGVGPPGLSVSVEVQ
ncbi:MAG: hypothetical protein KJ732_03195 [Candidatus Margulisbacteria bacterium]|nr:hypothetical protein [Candidatus Margulisiibacteriota bacterium]